MTSAFNIRIGEGWDVHQLVAGRKLIIGGVDIPHGARIAVLVGSANLDDDVFADAAGFQLDRANVGSHVAFGKGIHNCPGAGVARLEVRATLEVLATRLPTLRLADDPGYLFKPGATQRMAESLNLVWV